MRTEINIPQQNRAQQKSFPPTIPASVETPPQPVNIPPPQQLPPSLSFPSVLTLPVMANIPHSSRRHRHHHRKSRDHNVTKLLNPMATLSSSGESYQPVNCHKVWGTIACDACRVRPLTGARYKCLQCKNYDLCGSCMSMNVHSHHHFDLITCDAQTDAIMQKIRY